MHLTNFFYIRTGGSYGCNLYTLGVIFYSQLANEIVRNGDIMMQSCNHTRRLCIPSTKGFQILDLNNIIYCQADRSYTVFHCSNNEAIIVSKPLAEYDQLLTDAGFMRVHKSFLINLHHIKEYHRGEGGLVIMSNGTGIEVSRRKKDVFLERIKSLCRF